MYQVIHAILTILYITYDAAEAAQPAPPPVAAEQERAMETAANTSNHGILAPTSILDSSDVVPEEQPVPDQAAELQQEGAASSGDEEEEEEMRQYVHEMIAKARRELEMPSLTVQRFCRGNDYSWMWRRVRTCWTLIHA